MRVSSLLPLIATLLLGSGCASLSTLEEARALPAGVGRLHVATAGAVGSASVAPTLPNGAPAPLPVLDVGLRVGLGARTEGGVRMSPMTGVRADFKLQFLARGVDLAIDPTFTFHALPWDGRPRVHIEADVALLMGVAVGKRRWGYLGASVRGVVGRYGLLYAPTRFGKPAESAWTTFDLGAGLTASQGVGRRGRVRMLTGLDVRYDVLGGTGFKLAFHGGLAFQLGPVDPLRREQRRERRRERRERRRGGS